MKICIVGTGYVGLVTGAGFAETGNDVVCADVDQSKIDNLNAGKIPIFEPGLDELISRNVTGKRLSFSTNVSAAIASAKVVFIAVGTPPRTDGAADLSAVDRVAEDIARAAEGELVVVLKSTVPVGTNQRVQRIMTESARYPVHVVSNPEFLKEGDAVNDFLRPDRIVIGCDPEDEYAREVMQRLYHPVCLDKDRILWMDPRSAELTKYVANTMLAMRISFMNEVAGLCEQVGADIHEVRVGVGSDTRIGGKFLYAGAGYGGSCFPKDVKALLQMGRERGVELELVSATHRVNQRQKGILIRKLKRHMDDLRGKTIALWGIAFKPRTDDIREAPALTVIEALIAEGAKVVAHDPAARDAARSYFANHTQPGSRSGSSPSSSTVQIVDDAYSAAEGADALVLATEWRQYQNPDFERLRSLLKNPLLIDGRNIWTSYRLGESGFTYEGIGVTGSAHGL